MGPRTAHSFQKRSPLVRAELVVSRQWAAAVEVVGVVEAVERASPVQIRKSRARMVGAAEARVLQVGAGVGELAEVAATPRIAGAAAAKGRVAAKEAVEKANSDIQLNLHTLAAPLVFRKSH